MRPKASFVIPAYNAEAYLAQTIISCRQQSVKEIEIIVVNDGSTDGTKELAEWHASQDKRIRIIDLKENKGRSYARNLGNSSAESEIILVLDADDIALKNRVRDTLLHFNMKNVDILYGPFQVIDENGNIVATQGSGPFNKEINLKNMQNMIGHSTMAYRKGVTLNVQYSEGDWCRLCLDDWKFQWDSYLKGYKYGFTKVPLAQYRIYQLGNNNYGSTSSSIRNHDEVLRHKRAYIDSIQDALASKV